MSSFNLRDIRTETYQFSTGHAPQMDASGQWFFRITFSDLIVETPYFGTYSSCRRLLAEDLRRDNWGKRTLVQVEVLP